MKQLGDRLRDIRESKNLKQIEVANKTGINNKILSSYERNISLPTIDNLITLCNFYEISADYLLQIEPKIKEVELKAEKVIVPSLEQKRILSYYERLNEENKDAIKGLMVYYYKQQGKTNI